MDFIQTYISSASSALRPYAVLIGQTAGVLSVLQLLSPFFMFNSMRKAKSTLGMPFIPFLLIAVLTSLNVRFSQLLDDDMTFKANLIGFTISLVYISIFTRYVSREEKRKHFYKIFGTATFIGLAVLYSKLEDPEKIRQRFGLLLTSVMYCMFSLPVLGIYESLKYKCTRHLPFPIIFSGTLVGICWLLHGIVINSGFTIIQNLVMSLINLFQLSLFLIYPSEPASSSGKDGLANKTKEE